MTFNYSPDRHENILKNMSNENLKQITRFIGEHAFMANFHLSTLYVDGKPYPSVEHAYQASKAASEETKEMIRRAKTPMEAKKLGRALLLPEGWEEGKVDLMRRLVRSKFENPLLREMLRMTGDAELIQDNKWNDRFWGVYKGEGQNWLGKILMEIRQEILEEED
jgi:ribA/ribD-fused uncharacterized protein